MTDQAGPQIPESVREFAARRALSDALPERGVQAAVDLMMAGYDSQALRVLAGADDASPIDLDEMIATVFDELSLHVTPVAAEDWFVRRICRQYLAGARTRREAEGALREFEFGHLSETASDAFWRLFHATDPDCFRHGMDTPEDEFRAAFRTVVEAYLAGEPVGSWLIDGSDGETCA